MMENIPATTAPSARRKSIPTAPTDWTNPTTIDEGWRIAQYLAASKMVPPDFRGHPNEVMAAMMTGRNMGLNPTQSLSGLAVIGGRATVFGATAWGVVRSHPALRDLKIEMVGGGEEVVAQPKDKWPDAFGFRVSILRVDSDNWTSSIYLVGMARSAKLWNKTGPWQTNPQAMLRHRAFHDCARMAVPEALAGLYTTEEARDFDNVIEVAHTTVEPKPKPAARQPVLTVVPPVVAAPVAETEPAPKSESDASEEFAPPISLAPETAAVVAETAEKTLKHNIDDGMVAVLRKVVAKANDSIELTEASCEILLDYVRNQGYSPDGGATETLRCLLFHIWYQFASKWEWRWPINGFIPAAEDEAIKLACASARENIAANFAEYFNNYKATSRGDTQ